MNCKRPLRPRPGGPLGRLAPSSLVASGAARRATYGSTHFACGHTPNAGRTARRRLPVRTPASVTGMGFVGRLSHGVNPWVHGAPYARQTPTHPAHASHREPRERRVTRPPPLRSSEPTPSAKLVPVQERPAGGRGSDPTRANRGAFGKLSKWRCERVKPPSAARKNNDGPRGTGTAAAPRKSGAAARGMAPTPWRCCHRAGRRGGPSDQAQSFAEIAAQVTTPGIPRPRYCSASS